MKQKGNLLIVDDNKAVLHSLQLLLAPSFDKVGTLLSPLNLLNILRQSQWDILLLDMNFKAGMNGGEEGLHYLHEVKRNFPNLPVVLFTAYADIDLAVRGIKEGAADFVVKPWDNQKLIDTLQKALLHKQEEEKKSAENEKTTKKQPSLKTQVLNSVSTLEEMERELIVRTIKNNDGNLSAVAAQLDITRQTLYNKMKKYGI